jgi:hypothetical protein
MGTFYDFLAIPRLIFFKIVSEFSARFRKVDLSLMNDAHNHDPTPSLIHPQKRTVRDSEVRIWQGRSILNAALKTAGGDGGGRGGCGGGGLGFLHLGHCAVLILSLAIVTSDDQTESRLG